MCSSKLTKANKNGPSEGRCLTSAVHSGLYQCICLEFKVAVRAVRGVACV